MDIKSFRLLKLLMVFVLLAALLYSNFGVVMANSSMDDSRSSRISPEEYRILFAQYKSNGSAIEYERILNQMIEAAQVKQERIIETNGAVLQPTGLSGKAFARAQTTIEGYISDLDGYSPPMYNINTDTLVGIIQNPGNLVGEQDNSYAYLMTDGWNGDYSMPFGGESFMDGPVWDGYSGFLTGDIYIYAYTNAPSLDNYVMIEYCTYIFGGIYSWNYFDSVQVTNTSPEWIHVGYISSTFCLLAVECCTPPPHPTYYSPLIMNSVYVDCVLIV